MRGLYSEFHGVLVTLPVCYLPLSKPLLYFFRTYGMFNLFSLHSTEIPVFPTITARVTFQDFKSCENIPSSMFFIPRDYKVRVFFILFFLLFFSRAQPDNLYIYVLIRSLRDCLPSNDSGASSTSQNINKVLAFSFLVCFWPCISQDL